MIGAVLWAGLLLFALQLVARPDPRDALREADRLLYAGRYYEALAAYQPIADDLAEAQLRVGMVRVIRGERTPAERALRLALRRGLRPADEQLALIYLGRALGDAGRPDLAEDAWRPVATCADPAPCPYRAAALVLRSEAALLAGDTAAAAAGFTSALAAGLPPDWAALARYRLALIAAADDPRAALARLAAAPPQAAPAPLLAPLLTQRPDEGQLIELLGAPPAQRPQLLGQLYLGQGLYRLAEAQFALVPLAGPDGVAAAAYAAYTRWRAGDQAGSRARLAALVAEHPGEPRARMLLALVSLTAADADAARMQIDTVAGLTPNDPAVDLAWANWYAARRDYAEAALSYQRALLAAPPAERGRYALLGAHFHLATTYDQCLAGLPLAELAAALLADSPDALGVLAALRYHCGQLPGALEAARAAQAAGAGAEAVYYEGVSLAELGAAEARSALIRAADLAPASIWRERAEAALDRLP